jgi:hypothetical protein
MLWAYSVTLAHPVTGAEMTFTAPMPKTFTTKKVYDPGPRRDTAPE